MTAPDRASGLFFLLFGLALYFVIIPAQTEDGYEGHLLPQTMPNIVAWMIAICGGLLFLKPSDHVLHPAREFARAALFAGILFAAVFAMAYLGFVYVAPVLALVLMVLVGERRAVWLIIGALVVPATIWLLVTQVLERALP